MSSIVSQAGQTLIDISVQVYGSADYAYQLQTANDIGIHTTLPTGTAVVLPSIDTERTVARTVQYLVEQAIQPATAPIGSGTGISSPQYSIGSITIG